MEVEPSKTKLLQFGRFAEEDAQRKGKKPDEFDFLGFRHYCGPTRQGSFKVKRQTSHKKFRAKLKEMKTWLRSEHLGKGETLKMIKIRLARKSPDASKLRPRHRRTDGRIELGSFSKRSNCPSWDYPKLVTNDFKSIGGDDRRSCGDR